MMGPHVAMPDTMWGWMAAMAAVWIIPFIALAWLVITSLRRDDRDGAARILRERLAKGDIDQAQFETLRRALG